VTSAGGLEKAGQSRDRVARINHTMAMTSAEPGPQLAARGLGDHKHTSSDTFTLMAQSIDPSATSTPNLFPTTTANTGGQSAAGPGSANVYYLVVSLL
jgi:hypothetical protein